MRRYFTVVGLMLAVGAVTPGTAVADYPDGARSISGAYAEVYSGGYVPEEENQVCFMVYNTSTDAEWLHEIRFTFPAGWTVTSMSDQAGPNDSGGHAWYTHNPSANIAHWSEDATVGECSGFGEQYGNSDHIYCATVIAPAGTSGNQTVTYYLEGDQWGAAPHLVCSPGDPCNAICGPGTPETAPSDLNIMEEISREGIPSLTTGGIAVMLLALAGLAVLILRRRA